MDVSEIVEGLKRVQDIGECFLRHRADRARGFDLLPQGFLGERHREPRRVLVEIGVKNGKNIGATESGLHANLARETIFQFLLPSGSDEEGIRVEDFPRDGGSRVPPHLFHSAEAPVVDHSNHAHRSSFSNMK